MNVSQEQARLARLTMNQLRESFHQLYGEPSSSRNKNYLIRKILWRMQAKEEGDLSARVLAQALALANDADLRVLAPHEPTQGQQTRTVEEPVGKKDKRLPKEGTILTRKYKGTDIQVKVIAGGFEYRGVIYKSLSAVAKIITGSHCNGFAFFNLGDQ